MKRLFNLVIIIAVILIGFTAFSYFNKIKTKKSISASAAPKSFASINENNSSRLKKLESKTVNLKDYCHRKGFNSDVSFIVDMSVASGRARFFIYNLKTKSVDGRGLVTHGAGATNDINSIIFSNKPNSNCTSLGKYKVGNAYYGRLGLAYKLHGLESTNSNAFARFVVLHAHSCVPETEVYPLSICPSLGCPTVSPAFLQRLKTYISGSSKPILLYIYK